MATAISERQDVLGGRCWKDRMKERHSESGDSRRHREIATSKKEVKKLAVHGKEERLEKELKRKDAKEISSGVLQTWSNPKQQT